MPLIERILDEMDNNRESRYQRKSMPQLAQYKGFREDWNEYIYRFEEEINNDYV